MSSPLMVEGTVDVEDGIQVYYRRLGDGRKAVVIPAGMYLEEESKRLAAPHRTLLFYDMRGRGKSTKIADSARLGIEYELADLETLRRHFAFEQVTLIGFSYLGGVVLRYALRYPERVERIVQLGPIPPRRQPHMDQAAAALAGPADAADRASLQSLRQALARGEDPAHNREEYWRIFNKVLLYDPNLVPRFRSDYYTLANESPDNVDFQLATVFASFGDWDWRPQLGSLSLPVLVIHGDYDAVPLDGSREWVASLPNARLVIIPQAGHLAWAEKPEMVFPRIEAFLTGTWPK